MAASQRNYPTAPLSGDINGAIITATNSFVGPSIGTDGANQHPLPSGTDTLATEEYADDAAADAVQPLASPVLTTDYCAIDLGGADDQYLVVLGINSFNYFSDDPANARRTPWPNGHTNIGLIEVNPTTAVGADEDFKVEPWGCIYGYSGALQSAALSALDNVATARLTFNSGDTAAKRFLGNFPAVIGGLPLTHVALRISRLGISNYPGQLRIDVQARP